MTSTKLKVPELKKKLKELEVKDLIQTVADLYKMNQEVKDFLNVKFIGEKVVQELFERAKKEIEHEFFPETGFGKMRLAKAKKAITDFKKLTGDFEKVIDLMLFYVERGTKFTNTYGDIDERFYSSMESMYKKVAIACDKDEKLFVKFKPRLYAIVLETNGMGWGYHDYLFDVFHSISWVNET